MSPPKRPAPWGQGCVFVNNPHRKIKAGASRKGLFAVNVSVCSALCPVDPEGQPPAWATEAVSEYAKVLASKVELMVERETGPEEGRTVKSPSLTLVLSR